MVDVRAEGEKAEDLPELRTVSQMLAAGWGGIGRVASVDQALGIGNSPWAKRKIVEDRFSDSRIPRSISDDLDYLDVPSFLPRRQVGGGFSDRTPRSLGGEDDLDDLDIPAFLRRQTDENLPSEQLGGPSSRRFSFVERLKSFFFGSKGVKASSLEEFADWMMIYALRSAEPKQSLPPLSDLATAGLPDDLLAQLQALVAQGEPEEAVVTALFYAFLQHGPTCILPHNMSRVLRARFQRQVSASLAAAVDALVKTWCATG